MAEKLNRAWVESKLSLRDRNELFDAILEETTSPTGEQILNKIQELFPKKKNLPSIRAINKWKAQRWSFVIMLHGMRKTSEEAREIVATIPDDIEQANKKLINEILFKKLDDLKKNPNANEEGVQGWILTASKLAAQTSTSEIQKRKAKIMDVEVFDSNVSLKTKKKENKPEERALRKAKARIEGAVMFGGQKPSDEECRRIFEEELENAYNEESEE